MFATEKHLEATAKLVATMAHAGQIDKAREPYINHPARVADRLEYGRFFDRAVAWLHDVVEDTTVTLDDLRAVISPPWSRQSMRSPTARARRAPTTTSGSC